MKKRIDDEALLEEWTSVSRYEFQRPLGEGGDGAAYLVCKKSLNAPDKLFVLKVPMDDPQSIANLEAEIRLLLELEHPNIVAVHDHGYLDEEQRIPVLLLAHAGITLKHYLRSVGRLEPGLAIAVVLQVCAGLACAHEHGVIHRDVKPDNILVNRVGQVRIIDWGIAKGEHRPDKTMEDKIKGTATYLSPEMLDCDELGPTTDVWQVGVLLYHLLTGVEPWQIKERADRSRDAWKVDLGMQIKEARHASIPPELCPSNLMSVIDRCLEKAPTKRYQSMLELIRALYEVRLVAPHIAAVEVGQHACAAEDTLTRDLKPTNTAVTVPIHAEKRASAQTSSILLPSDSMMVSDSMEFAAGEFVTAAEKGRRPSAPVAKLASSYGRVDNTQEFEHEGWRGWSFSRALTALTQRRVVLALVVATAMGAGAAVLGPSIAPGASPIGRGANAHEGKGVPTKEAPAAPLAPSPAAKRFEITEAPASPETAPSPSPSSVTGSLKGPDEAEAGHAREALPPASSRSQEGVPEHPSSTQSDRSASVTIVVLPAGSFVSVDKRSAVAAPVTLDGLRVGWHVVRAGLQKGSLTKTERVELKSGPNQVRIVLADPFAGPATPK